MNKKTIALLLCVILLATVLPVTGIDNIEKINVNQTLKGIAVKELPEIQE